jgi:hypothetical protein
MTCPELAQDRLKHVAWQDGEVLALAHRKWVRFVKQVSCRRLGVSLKGGIFVKRVSWLALSHLP